MSEDKNLVKHQNDIGSEYTEFWELDISSMQTKVPNIEQVLMMLKDNQICVQQLCCFD